MSDMITRHMSEPYLEEFGAPMFLSSFFRARSFTSELVEVDIQRSTGKVAIVVKDISSGARYNTVGKFSNKEMRPAVVKEAISLSGFDLLGRQIGQRTHVDPVFGANLNAKIIRSLPMIVDKTRRTVELMSAQVLQTGSVTLTDENGATMYTISFDPKADHFPTVTASWGGVGADPIKDLRDLCVEIKKNGRTRARRAIFGKDAISAFLDDDRVQKRLDNRRLSLGEMGPASFSDEGTYWGDVNVDSAILEIWTYDGDYEDPATGNVVPYVGDDKVVVVGSGARLDLYYGALPYVKAPDPAVMSMIPGRVGGNGLDLTLNAFVEANNTALTVEVGTRPISIPVAIDTFGCLTTTAPDSV